MSESELDALRRTVAELLAKRDKYKARIKELETSSTELQTKLTASESAVHDLTVGAPLRTLSETLSTVPELFKDQLTRLYKVQLVDGKPALHTLEGNPVVAKDGKALPFEHGAIRDFLTSSDNPNSKVFSTITIATRASGAGGSASDRRPSQHQAQQQPGKNFGLR